MRTPFVLLALLLVLLGSSICAEEDKLRLSPRTRIETADGSGRYHAVTRAVEWDSSKTAAVVCDMWQKHWCAGATRRVADMANRMNDVLVQLRKRGVLIIHCPSAGMKYYEGTPQRKRAQSAPPVETKVPLEKWCSLDKSKEAALPIDDSDGGCDCEPQCSQKDASKRMDLHQIRTLGIEEGDAITDSAEAYYLMVQRGIKNVIVMGVHTNMCVLGRPFSIRQMVYQGQNVLLMRDLTDTMYNSRMHPFVDHHTGTDLVVEHIERHWVPTISSDQILGGKPFRFERDRRKHLVIVMAEDEYQTHETLPRFARKHLGKDFRISYGDSHVQPRVRSAGRSATRGPRVLGQVRSRRFGGQLSRPPQQQDEAEQRGPADLCAGRRNGEVAPYPAWCEHRGVHRAVMVVQDPTSCYHNTNSDHGTGGRTPTS